VATPGTSAAVQQSPRMNSGVPFFLALTQPMAIGIGVAALVFLYLAFKATKVVLKLLLLLAALSALGGAAWWYFNTHPL
jgi:hypothetical protein